MGGPKKTKLLDPTGYLPYKANPPRWGVIADLSNRNKHKEANKVGRQRNWPQMKEWEKSPEKDLNEMETSNLSDIEFKIMIIRMLNGIKRTRNP